jgi:hypothetical protein
MLSRSMWLSGGNLELKNYLLKVAIFALQLAMSSFVFVAIHEESHYLMASWLHVSGWVSFNLFQGGTFWFNNISVVTPGQNALVAMAGGLGTALVAGVLWLTTDLQKSIHWAAIFCVITVTQTIYGTSEALNIWVPSSAAWGQMIAALAAYSLGSVIYGYRVLDWLDNRREIIRYTDLS